MGWEGTVIIWTTKSGTVFHDYPWILWPQETHFHLVDGSPIGLGFVLTQKDVSTKEVTPLHYASCSFAPTEARYLQIDREALSVYWAIRHFHLVIYGEEFKVIADHQPLLALLKNPTSKPSARIERWHMELQQYRFTVEYHPDASNLADYASRHPVEDLESHNFEVESEEHISFIARNAVRKAATSEVESATAEGPVLQAVISVMKSGCWHNAPCGVSPSELSRFEQVASQGAIY